MNNIPKSGKRMMDHFKENRDPRETARTKASMSYAVKIASILKHKKWNKDKLAKAMEVRNSVVTRWLSGTHNFTIHTLTDIGVALGVDLLLLEKRDEKITPVIKMHAAVVVKAIGSEFNFASIISGHADTLTRVVEGEEVFDLG